PGRRERPDVDRPGQGLTAMDTITETAAVTDTPALTPQPPLPQAGEGEQKLPSPSLGEARREGPRAWDGRGVGGEGRSLLPTTVVGSYSVPEWLERLKTDYYQRRISGTYLREIHEVAIKAAMKDQEQAGVEIVSDGELRRDNDIDYFLARMPGV